MLNTWLLTLNLYSAWHRIIKTSARERCRTKGTHWSPAMSVEQISGDIDKTMAVSLAMPAGCFSEEYCSAILPQSAGGGGYALCPVKRATFVPFAGIRSAWGRLMIFYQIPLYSYQYLFSIGMRPELLNRFEIKPRVVVQIYRHKKFGQVCHCV